MPHIMLCRSAMIRSILAIMVLVAILKKYATDFTSSHWAETWSDFLRS
jgi:hypothetical protein